MRTLTLNFVTKSFKSLFVMYFKESSQLIGNMSKEPLHSILVTGMLYNHWSLLKKITASLKYSKASLFILKIVFFFLNRQSINTIDFFLTWKFKG